MAKAHATITSTTPTYYRHVTTATITTNTPNYFHMVTTHNATNGWFYSTTFNHWQKVNQGVYVYVTPMLFGAWYAQLYLRGTATICSLEVRTQSNGAKLFPIAERWLTVYADGNVTRISADFFSISNPMGAWSPTNYALKWYWV